VTVILAQWPGATEVRDEGALTYGQRDPKMKAVVKKGSTREEDVGGAGRGNRGGTMSRCGLDGVQGLHGRVSGSRGGVDVAPSVDSSFSSSSPLILLFWCAVVWMGMKPQGG
jgi:hypothetical protein